jgi:hypothetical protein
MCAAKVLNLTASSTQDPIINLLASNLISLAKIFPLFEVTMFFDQTQQGQNL